MTSIEEHKNSIRELVKDITEKMRSNLLVERQQIIGFSASEASCNMLALFLHKRAIISPGFQVNHGYFRSEKLAREKIDVDFPEKKRILELLVRQEHFRYQLWYGRAREKSVVEEAIRNMFSLKELIEGELGEEI
ncbi:MAG: hypothetical protein HY520_01570 [Candidatus Aenigmarchaeota archaeon]|nr:hypothetical protein [Candidatus Aenigmarchaeota archaeon]